jgi:hypothetical protein
LEEEDLLTLVRGFTESYAIAEQLVRQGSPKLYSTEELMPKFISTEETSQEACLALNSPQFCFAKLLPTQADVSSDEKALDKLLSTIVPPPRPNSIQPLSVDSIIASLLDSSSKKDTKEKKKNVGRMEHYYEAMNHNTFAKVDKQNVVESLNDFKGTPLTKPLYDTHIFMYNAKVFKIKTFKDAFIEFTEVHTKNISKNISGTIQERDKKLEQKYRALNKNKLYNQLLKALYKFNVKYDINDDDLYSDNGVIIPNELDILPKTNEINLALPFNISTTSEHLPTNIAEIIYTQLLKLIALEKAKKLGQGHRRKKTLRKRRKAPYANKKSKRR